MKLLVATLCAGLLLATSAAAEPYGFRGATLGMTLDAFKATPYPDDPASGIFPDCTDGPYSQLDNWAAREAGVVQCGFQGKIDLRDMSGPGLDLKIGVGSYVSPFGLYTYAFAPANDGVRRLYSFSFNASLAAFEAVVANMTALYGKPASIVDAPQDWPAGSPYRLVYTWSSGTSRLVVRADPKTNQGPGAYPNSGMNINYFDAPHQEAVQQRIAQVQRRQPASTTARQTGQ